MNGYKMMKALKVNNVRKVRLIEELWSNIGLLNVFEIGSRGGAFTDLSAIASFVNYYGFEPDAEECERLNTNASNGTHFSSEQYFPVAIGSERETLQLNITAQPGCSSFLSPNMDKLRFFGRSEWFEVTKCVDVPVIPFDDLVQGKGIDRIDFIKLDVEGMELDILRGAEEALKHLNGIRLEVNYLDHRKNQASFAEIINHLTERGFKVFRYLENHAWRPDSKFAESHAIRGDIPFSFGQLAHGDVLLFRSPSSESEVNSIPPLEALRLASLWFACGFLSHANALVQSAQVQEFIADEFGLLVEEDAFTDASRQLRKKIRRDNFSRYFGALISTLRHRFPH